MSQDYFAKDIHDLIRSADDARAGLKNEAWWRGQPEAGMPLIPGVFRRDGGWRYEQQIARRFIQGAASRHHALPPLHERAQWLFLMQHYRLPTRLLDWTESLLVATYFAVNEKPQAPGAVYALDPIGLNRACINQERVQVPQDLEMQTVLNMAFDEGGGWDNIAIAVVADQIDSRMLVQLSAFTLHGGATPMHQLPRAETYIRKIEIPPEAKPALMASLHLLGVRRSTLFPDLANLAEELADTRYTWPR